MLRGALNVREGPVVAGGGIVQQEKKSVNWREVVSWAPGLVRSGRPARHFSEGTSMPASLFARLRRLFAQPGELTRRGLLRAALAASAGHLLSESIAHAAAPPARGKRVLVVGAGLGGLACGHELAGAGYDV